MAILDDALTAESPADDVVEGEAELVDAPPESESDDAVAAEAAPLTLEAAVMEYFVWEEQRSARRARQASSRARAKRDAYVFDAAAREAVTRFLWHFGAHTPIAELSPKSMEGFQETIGANTLDLVARLQPVKEFLRFCKDRGYTVTQDADGGGALNLGNFLRVKRTAAVERDSSSFQHEEATVFEMTAAGLDRLKQERTQLEQEMPMAVQAVADAREDKDIRENAPLEAAREYQERLKSRIDELEYQIDHAVVREQRETGRAKLGSRVSVVEIDERGEALGEAREYTLVGTTELVGTAEANATAANAAARRISVESPLGRGLLDQTVNGRIEIDAPSGRKRFRLLGVSG